jgi:hypothetical protein
MSCLRVQTVGSKPHGVTDLRDSEQWQKFRILRNGEVDPHLELIAGLILVDLSCTILVREDNMKVDEI